MSRAGRHATLRIEFCDPHTHRTLDTARSLFRSKLEGAPADARRIEEPVAPVPAISKALGELYERARVDALNRAGLS